MFLKRSTLRRIILENLLNEAVFSAAATGFAWQNVSAGMPGAVTTHGRSLLTALSEYSASLGSAETAGLASEFAARGGARAIMNHNMKSLTTACNRGGGESAFNALQKGLGEAGAEFSWVNGEMVFVGTADTAVAFGSGVTAASVGFLLAVIAAGLTVPGLAIYEYSTMKLLDKRLKNLHRMSGPAGQLKPVAPFSGGQFDIKSEPGKELTAILPLIFQAPETGANANLRQKARLPTGDLGKDVKALPASLAMGNNIIKLINDGIVDKDDLSKRYYDVFVVPAIKESKAVKNKIAETPAIKEGGSGDTDTAGDKKAAATKAKTGSSSSSSIQKIQKIINDGSNGKWTKETNVKLSAYATSNSVTTDPQGLEWWKSWKNSAPKIKSMTVGKKTMTFGTRAGNPQLKGNLSSLLKVLEFIRDSKVQG